MTLEPTTLQDLGGLKFYRFEPTHMDGFNGHAAASDPRERYDDLIVESGVETYDPATYAERRAMEAYRSGWVAVGVVVDESGRVLLVYDDPDDEWVAPGGTLQPGESLHDGLVREIEEEAGVRVEPVRPHAVAEWTARNEDDRENWTGFRVATFEATAARTTPGDDLGVDDEEITDADWFDSLPENTYHRDRTQRILDRIRDS